MAPALEIHRRPLDDGVELELRGELEIATVSLLRRVLHELRDEDVSRVRLDTAHVQQMFELTRTEGLLPFDD